MKKLIRIAFPILIFACLFAAMSVTSSAAGLADDSYYDLWVGGVAVNPANERDVLGDGKVSFDPDTRTLTLDGATVEGYVSEYNYYLSIYSKSTHPTNVVIKGKTKLAHGIRLARGSVTVDGATLSFSENAMTAFCLYGDDSSVTVKNSTVKISGSTLADARQVPLIYAKNISLESSELSISFAVDAGSIDSIVHATGKLTAVDSDIKISQAIPTAYYALYANEEMTFTDCSVKLTAPMYAFYAPQGTVSLIRSAAEIKSGFFALQAAGLRMESSSLEADVFYDGIYVASSKVEDVEGEEDKVTVKPTEVIFDRSTVRVTQLAYSRLKTMLNELWGQMSADAKL